MYRSALLARQQWRQATSRIGTETTISMGRRTTFVAKKHREEILMMPASRSLRRFITSGAATRGRALPLHMTAKRLQQFLQRQRRLCGKPKEGESASSESASSGAGTQAGEEASRSIPHLVLGMTAGVGGCWLGLGGLVGATYMAGQMGDNAFAGRLSALLLLGSLVLPPAVGAVCFQIVIQMEWGFGFFVVPATLFYGVPIYSFFSSSRENKSIDEETRAKRMKMLMNLNQTDLQNLHATAAKLCDQAKNMASTGGQSDESSWGSFGGTGGSYGSFGSTSSSSFGDASPLVSKDNVDTLVGVLREAFNAGANQSGVLKKKDFYRAMSGAVSQDEKEMLMFFNRITRWGMTREIDFREFAFTMLFFIARSEENYSAYQEALFKYLDTQATGSLGLAEITELVDLTERFFGKPKGSGTTLGMMGWGQKTHEDIAKDAMSQIGKTEASRCEPHEFSEIMTNMGFSY
eukprot:g2692.t1